VSLAKQIALTAHERAMVAADLEAAHEEAIQMDHEWHKREAARLDFEAALPVLNEWFPGVKWRWSQEGDYNYDCIIMEDTSDWNDVLKLRAQLRRDDRTGEKVQIEIGRYVQDTSTYGTYFSGAVVKSAADIGRYLKSALVERYGK
jgi:hypothetical protein